MTYKQEYSFINYLMERHADQYIGLDDDMPDDYNDWIDQLDVQEVIDYADLYLNDTLNKKKI